MIKVCHIVNLITGKADGVYTHLKMIFENSDRDKFQHFLIFQGGDKIENEVRQLGVKVFISESLKKKISLRSFIDIYKFIKENEIDIIHTHLIKPYAIAGLVNIILRRKFIFNYHGIFLSKNIYYGFFEKFVYRMIHFILYISKVVDVVLVPSNRSKELLLNETGLFSEPVVYYNGYPGYRKSAVLNEKLVERIKTIKKSKKIIALIGRLEIDKRINKALSIVKNLILKGEKVHLLIFGDGRLMNYIQNIIDEEKLNEHIDLLGYVEGLNNYYKFFDLVLFTSDWEGMPLTMWEAMANKIPVVAPDVGGFKEILEENNCGIVYDSQNLNEAEDILFGLLNNEEDRIKMGENGLTAVIGKYTSQGFIESFEEIYTNLIS
jgi:L-malate glycosyltransferase